MGRSVDAQSSSGRFPLELAGVWALFAVVALEILVTYSRLAASQLYHVFGSGLTGGGSRVLVFSNFPLALVAIPILALLGERLPGAAAKAVAVVGALLCAAIFWPGIVDQADLDARPVNAICAIGVVIALGLTIYGAVRLGRPERPARRPGDLVRIVIAVVVLAVALPWIAADLGFFLNGVPVLGRVFQSGPYLHRLSGLPPFPPAVHHGHHHGMDGVLLVLSALLFSRVVPDVRSKWLRSALTAYLALMFCYGVGNIANDFWIEQVVKRGWTPWEVPNVLEPRLTLAWGVIVLAALVLWRLAERRPQADSRPI